MILDLIQQPPATATANGFAVQQANATDTAQFQQSYSAAFNAQAVTTEGAIAVEAEIVPIATDNTSAINATHATAAVLTVEVSDAVALPTAMPSMTSTSTATSAISPSAIQAAQTALQLSESVTPAAPPQAVASATEPLPASLPSSDAGQLLSMLALSERGQLVPIETSAILPQPTSTDDAGNLASLPSLPSSTFKSAFVIQQTVAQGSRDVAEPEAASVAKLPNAASTSSQPMKPTSNVSQGLNQQLATATELPSPTLETSTPNSSSSLTVPPKSSVQVAQAPTVASVAVEAETSGLASLAADSAPLSSMSISPPNPAAAQASPQRHPKRVVGFSEISPSQTIPIEQPQSGNQPSLLDRTTSTSLPPAIFRTSPQSAATTVQELSSPATQPASSIELKPTIPQATQPSPPANAVPFADPNTNPIADLSSNLNRRPLKSEPPAVAAAPATLEVPVEPLRPESNQFQQQATNGAQLREPSQLAKSPAPEAAVSTDTSPLNIRAHFEVAPPASEHAILKNSQLEDVVANNSRTGSTNPHATATEQLTINSNVAIADDVTPHEAEPSSFDASEVIVLNSLPTGFVLKPRRVNVEPRSNMSLSDASQTDTLPVVPVIVPPSIPASVTMPSPANESRSLQSPVEHDDESDSTSTTSVPALPLTPAAVALAANSVAPIQPLKTTLNSNNKEESTIANHESLEASIDVAAAAIDLDRDAVTMTTSPLGSAQTASNESGFAERLAPTTSSRDGLAEPTHPLRQVVSAMNQAVESGERLRVHLNPPELGTVMIEVARTSHGIVAKIEFSNASTQQTVANSLPELHRSLSQTGIVMDRVEVTIRDQRSESQDGQSREDRGRQQGFQQQRQEHERQRREQQRRFEQEREEQAA